jgi:hypothetical protein
MHPDGKRPFVGVFFALRSARGFLLEKPDNKTKKNQEPFPE